MPTMMGVIFDWKIALLCNLLKCQYDSTCSITLQKNTFWEINQKIY